MVALSSSEVQTLVQIRRLRFTCSDPQIHKLRLTDARTQQLEILIPLNYWPSHSSDLGNPVRVQVRLIVRGQ